MSLRFRKSFKLASWLRLNLTGSGASLSIGPRGLGITIGNRRTTVHAGLLGTGLSWRQQWHGRRPEDGHHNIIPGTAVFHFRRKNFRRNRQW